MNLQKKSRQFSLASVFICLFIPQVQAGVWDEVKNIAANAANAANAAKQVTDETVDEVIGSKPAPSTQEQPRENQQSEPIKTEPQTAEKNPATTKQDIVALSANLDVVGFRLGMSPDDVTETLLGYRDDFKIEAYNSFPASQNRKSEVVKEGKVDVVQNADENNLPEHIYEIRAYVQGGNESFEFNFLKPPAPNTVYRVNRTLTFTKDKAPEDKKITQKLKAKYGEVYSEETPDSIQWVYDDNGNLRREADRYLEQYCDGRLDENFPLLDATGGCGTWVSTKIRRATGTNFVEFLSVTIADRKAHLSNQKESKALIAQMKNSEMKNKQRDIPNI